MLTIQDLSTSKELDRAALATVHGGNGYPTIDIDNYPYFDLSKDVIFQKSFTFVDQSNNWGGVNFAYVKTTQHASN